MALPASLSLAPSHQLSQLRHSDRKPYRLKLEPLKPCRRRYHHSYVFRSVLDSRTPSSINDNGATEPARILLERLFAQTQKLEEQISRDPSSAHATELGMNLVKLESDLQAALSALKKKEKNLQEAERKVSCEIDELNLTRQDLERREEVIVATGLKQEKLEEELRLANLELASRAAEIGNLKFSLKEKENEISALQSGLSAKEGEIMKMKHELASKTKSAAIFEFELLSKSRLVEETNKIVEKQKIELGFLKSEIRKKERELEVSIGLQRSESEKVKAAEAKLEKQATDWLVAREELRNLANETSKQGIGANETVEEFGRVRKLLLDVRSELVSSREALVLSREKMEGQDKLLEKQLLELEEQRNTVVSYLTSLREAEIEVESERVKLKLAEARNKELERDVALERELVEELQKELENERCSLERAVQEKLALCEKIEQNTAAFKELQMLLEAKESELVEARLEIQHLKSEQSSLRLVLEEKNSELSDAKVRLEEMNRETSELKGVLLEKEDEVIKAMALMRERDEDVLTLEAELMGANFKYSEAESVVENIVNLTREIVQSPLEPINGGLSGEGYKWEIKRLEAELEFTRESLRAKETEVVAARKDLVIKDGELRALLSELDSREKEIAETREEITRENEDLKKLYALAQETIGEKSVGELAIERLRLEAAQLEVEAATVALWKITEMSREVLGRAGSSVGYGYDAEISDQSGSGGWVNMGGGNCTEVVKSEVSRLLALTEQLVREAGMGG